MAKRLPKTGERLIPSAVNSRDDLLQYLRHVFAYDLGARTLAGAARVLDFGCGEGYGTRLLADHVGDIVGVDVEESVIAHASAEYGRVNCRFQRYDGERLPFDAGAFDAVVSFQVIEHIWHDRQYVAEAARVLKPGGRFLVTTPNAANRLKPGSKPWNRFHVREYVAGQLKEVLAASFADVKVAGITAGPEVHVLEMARIRQSLKIVTLDPLNLRRFIPESLKPWATRVARRLMPRKQKSDAGEDWKTRYSLADYSVTTDDLANSLDLLAVCVR
jgi:SAM-dependent methyltransferase